MQKQRLRLHDLLDDPSTYFRMRHAWDGNTPFHTRIGYLKTKLAVPQTRTLERIADTYKVISGDTRTTHDIIIWMLERSNNTQELCSNDATA